MDLEEKKRLSGVRDLSKEACCKRLLAARMTTGLSQTDFAGQVGYSPQSINNLESRSENYPNRKLIHALYELFRVDYNFIYAGEFAQLPADLQDKLFSALDILDKSPGHKPD